MLVCLTMLLLNVLSGEKRTGFWHTCVYIDLIEKCDNHSERSNTAVLILSIQLRAR